MIRRKKLSLSIIAVGLVLFSGVVLSQTKRDFEKAARETGCDLIPYSGMNTRCHSAYGRQNNWCSGDKQRGCKDLTKDQKDEARARRDNAIECLKHREEVRSIYNEALDTLSRQKEDDLKPYVDEIVRRIQAEQPIHADFIEQTKNRRDRCEELLR